MMAANGSQPAGQLLIPVYGSDEMVEVPLDALPEVVDDVIDILKAEGAPLALWLDLARAYLAQGLTGQYTRVLTEATSEEAAGYFGPGAKYERIQGLCSLAAFNAHQAKAEKSPEVRATLFARASELLGHAARLDHEEQLPHLGLGQVALLQKGDVVNARKEFERASRLKSNGRPSIAGLLALAGLEFGQRNYKEGLALYRRALSEFPECPADVRLGLAACYFRLGNTSKAAAAYERVLDLDPACTQALLGLAVIRLSINADAESVKEGSQLLTQAFQQDPENPYALVLLAHFCLQQGFYDKAHRLAQLVLERADVDALRAESLTILARAEHALGQLTQAWTHYQQASVLDQRLILPKYGLAQISVLRGETTNAVSILESLLQEMPGWFDALRVLGRLYPRMPAKGGEAAEAQFKAATIGHGGRPELWEILGDIMAPTDPAAALANYHKSIELYRQQPPDPPATDSNGLPNGDGPAGGVPARVLNNAAVLALRGGSVDKARELMGEALASAQQGGLQKLGALAQVTLGYNMARVREAGGELQAAEAEYRALLEQFPQYADCYLRLACVAKLRGDTKEALEWAQKASDVSGRSADSLALRATLYLERRDYANAKKVLDELLGEASGGALEAYGKVAMGNLHLYTTPGDRRRDEQRHKAEAHLSHALELFRRVLEKEPGNVYAANGVGCVLAESGHLNSAKEVFLQVQEASAATDGFFRMPDAWTNLANVYLAQEHYGQACAMYRNALRKFYEGRNAQLLLYLARAHYDADQVLEAKRVLVKALHLAPTDCSLRFDVALTMQEYAVRTLTRARATNDPTRLVELSQAVAELERAHRYFTQLNDMGVAVTGIDSKKLQTHINFIAETHKKAREIVLKAQRDAELADAKRQEQLKRMEAAQKARELEERRRLLAEESAARARDAMARENAAKLEALKASWRETAAIAKAAAEGDSSKVAKGRAKKKAAEEAALDALFAEEEGDEDYAPGQESDGEGAPGPSGQAALEAAGLASSEEEEDFELEDDEEEEGEGAGIDFGSDEEGRASGGGDAAARKEARKKKKEERRRLKKERRRSEKKAATAAAAAAAAGGGAEQKKGRLKKRSRETAVAALGLEDEEEEAAAGAEAAAAEGGGGGGGSAGPAKRQRQAALLDDESEEEEGEGPGAAAGNGEPGDEQQQQAIANLFGSDDED